MPTQDEKVVSAFKGLPKGAQRKIIASLKGTRPILVGTWVARTDMGVCGCLMCDGMSEERMEAFKGRGDPSDDEWANELADFYRMISAAARLRILKMQMAYDMWASEFYAEVVEPSDGNMYVRQLTDEGRAELLKLLEA